MRQEMSLQQICNEALHQASLALSNIHAWARKFAWRSSGNVRIADPCQVEAANADAEAETVAMSACCTLRINHQI